VWSVRTRVSYSTTSSAHARLRKIPQILSDPAHQCCPIALMMVLRKNTVILTVIIKIIIIIVGMIITNNDCVSFSILLRLLRI
jgi:hypothetical protein